LSVLARSEHVGDHANAVPFAGASAMFVPDALQPELPDGAAGRRNLKRRHPFDGEWAEEG
jgi:hypothetical protein